MAPALPRYTPYRDVNIILHRLRTDVEEVLGAQLVGIYLYGSLSLGDFNPATSDIDFLVVTAGELSNDTLTHLQAMHSAIAESNLPYARALEGSYIPQTALRRYDPVHCEHPCINSHDGIVVRREPHGQDWAIQRHIIREHGVVITGPSPDTLIDPVSSENLQAGVRDLLYGWWTTLLDSPILEQGDYQAFAVLTMCRMLYTFEHGDIVSKPVAAQWALSTLKQRWHWLIEWALAYPDPPPRNPLEEIRALIRYTLEKASS